MWRSTAAVVGALTLGVLVSAGVVVGVGETLPAWAGEAEDAAHLEMDAQWRAFAVDLASASGCSVTYESPIRAVDARGEWVSRENGDYGSIGMLRIGAPVGPAVLVMPDGFLRCSEASKAYAHAGLREPRRFAQELVEAAAFSQGAAAADKVSLAHLLRDRAVLLPVCVAESWTAQAVQSAGNPDRNFPVRWEDAALAVPTLAGPYPASHPAVRALTAWLKATPDCAALVTVGDKAKPRSLAATFPAGTLRAFSAEVMGLHVSGSPAEGSIPAIEQSLRGCGALAFVEPQWTRLGATNWSLDVTIELDGHTSGVTRPVLLTAVPVDGNVSMTAAAAADPGEGDGEVALELLPLRRQGIVLDGGSKAGPRRVRLFFSESPQGGAGELKRRSGAPGEARDVAPPTVELRATSPQVRPGVIRTKSPV